jgi:hypothetical protein
MVSENTIFFYPGRGGHSHDGENSSFIDTSKYSLFDFSWGLLGDPDRQASQDRNYNSFKDFIINTVNQSILNPAGLVLQPGIVNGTAHIISRSLTTELIAANAITANEILAGTITADELSANLVLVNNVIRSNNFNGNIAANGSILTYGTTGWAIAGDGTAVFDSSYIRGTIIAGAVSTPGVDILSNGAIISNNFSVTADGILSANSANISGEITATSGAIAGWAITGDNLTSGGGYVGNMVIGPGYGTSNTGAVFISAHSGTAGKDSEAYHDGYGSFYADRITSNNTITKDLQVTSGGIYYQYGHQSFEFAYDAGAGLLYAYIDGVPYCITECGSTPPTTTTTADPGGGGGGGTTAATTTAATTTAAPSNRICTPATVGIVGGCTSVGQCHPDGTGPAC